MAVVPQDRDLLRDFWQQNKEVIVTDTAALEDRHKELIAIMAGVLKDDSELPDEDRKKLAIVEGVKGPPLPFIKPLYELLAMVPGLRDEWSFPAQPGRSLSLNFLPLRKYLDERRRRMPGLKVQGLGFFIGDDGKPDPILQLRFTAATGVKFEDCQETEFSKLMENLRSLIRDAVTNKLKEENAMRPSMNLCYFKLPADTETEKQTKRCLDITTTLMSVVRDWFATLPR
jgi:hypothetical protein